jgi:hypothetical protein
MVLRYYKTITQQKQNLDYNMITINLNAVKTTLRLALLASLTYLLFSITNNYNTIHINFTTEDTSTASFDHYLK